jgi:hypothetical protein
MKKILISDKTLGRICTYISYLEDDIEGLVDDREALESAYKILLDKNAELEKRIKGEE